MDKKIKAIDGEELALDDKRRKRAQLYSDEVKVWNFVPLHREDMYLISRSSLCDLQRDQMHNELSVEAIVRQRSLYGAYSLPRS